MISDTAIVFTIFDGYEDLWDDAINLIKKFWINHPPIYVFTNEITKEWTDVTCIAVGKDAEWSRKVQKAISVVKEKYMIMLLEDFYVGSEINDSYVEKLIKYMSTNNIKYCKLCDNNRVIRLHQRNYKDSKYKCIYSDEEYGISLQPSIWEKDFLAKTVGKENYNAWVFELNQVKKEKKADHKILSYAIEDTRNVLNIKHGALQSKMLPNTIKYFEKIGCPLSTDREIMSKPEYLKNYLKFLGKGLVPKFAVKSVKKAAKLFGYSFVDEKWN